MSVQQIKKRIDAILIYMTDHWEFVNCHMVNYLTDKHWLRFVPESLRSEVQGVEEVAQCIHGVFFGGDSKGFPQFSEFLRRSEQHRVGSFPEVLTTREQLSSLLQRSQEEVGHLSIKEFMNDKKKHEVEIVADLIDGVVGHCKRTQQHDEVYLADAGDGKGYLSSRLALQYGYKVLGIDFRETNTENALERSKKLQRAWPALSERALLEMKGLDKKPRNHQQQSKKAVANYKTISKFITTDLDIANALRDAFGTTSEPLPVYGLSGLHTCGDLAATCLRVFHTQAQCKVLCNVGCCYHLLKEEFVASELYRKDSTTEAVSESGFPMSRYLRERRVQLGRNARMLAAQSIDRTVAGRELPNISLYYRALLEVLICAQRPELKNTVQVGKLKKYTNFREYLALCEAKLQMSLAAGEEGVQRQFEAERHYLELFYLLRMSFAPVLEALIMLDRLLYLRELNYEHSHLVALFDPVISPRNLGIVAWKH